MKLLLLLLISTFASHSLAQVSYSKYPSFRALTNFNTTRFLGTWYEIKRTPNPYEINQKCSIVGYKSIPNLPLIAYMLSKDKTTGEISRLLASNTPLGKSLARWDFRYPANLLESNGVTSVLDTDYDNYAVKTLLQPKNNGKSGWLLTIWILSRQQTLSANCYKYVQDFLSTINISFDEMEQVDQRGCDIAEIYY